jgi:hypothetical protein
MKARPQGSAALSSTSAAKQASFADLAAYCPDLAQWREKIVEYFTPFLRHLLNSNLSRATLRKHRDNLHTQPGHAVAKVSGTSISPSKRRPNSSKMVSSSESARIQLPTASMCRCLGV